MQNPQPQLGDTWECLSDYRQFEIVEVRDDEVKTRSLRAGRTNTVRRENLANNERYRLVRRRDTAPAAAPDGLAIEKGLGRDLAWHAVKHGRGALMDTKCGRDGIDRIGTSFHVNPPATIEGAGTTLCAPCFPPAVVRYEQQMAAAGKKNPEARRGDVWASAGGMRRFTVVDFVRDGAAVQVKSTRLGQPGVIDLVDLRDPAKYELVERYDAETVVDQGPLDSLPRLGPTVLL